MTFKEMDLDKLNECAEPLDEIFSEKELFESEKYFTELAIPIYQKHKEAIDKLFELREEKPENAMQMCLLFNKIMLEISQDKETASFFTYMSKNLRLMIFAMANTEGKQPQDT